jgi:hypothetical protein
MRSWKNLLNDKRWLFLLGIVAFAVLATLGESLFRRGQKPNVALQQRQLEADERHERERQREQRRAAQPPLPEEFAGTTDAVERLKPDPAPAGPVMLRRIRTGGHDDFDRVVFDFDGDVPPGFRVEYVDKLARKCGADELKVTGGTWLLVRMTPAMAHLENGRTSVGGVEMDEDLKLLKLVRPVCDADGQLEWMIEVTERKPYRAEPRMDPARLVIDIKHERATENSLDDN